MKRAIKWLVILSVCIGGGYFVLNSTAKDDGGKAPAFDRAVAEIRDLRTVVESTGEVQPRNRLDVKPPIAGRLEELLVDEGDVVEKGQILGWVSSTERATLLDAALATSQEEFEHWKMLYKPTPLISPLKGTIIARNFEPGQSIDSKDAVVVIADDLIVVANLDETDIGKIWKEQVVNVRLEAYPEREFACKVEKIAYDARTVSNVTMYEVDVRPEKLPGFARSGMTANLEFIIQERNGALVVPASAVQQRVRKKGGDKKKPEGERRNREGKKKKKRDKSGAASFVYRDSGDAENPVEQKVMVGISDGSYVEILEGLAQGDEVLIKKIKIRKKGSSNGSPFMPARVGRGGGGGGGGGGGRRR